jgi:NADH-quinone oxidoreductase subunit F
MQRAIDDARKKGFLGKNILGSDFDFDCEIVRGGGAFVCGESSALMASIEGKVGEPRVKYIRSVVKGLFDQPTVLNNVETLANIPYILTHGGETFAKMGTKGSKGTKVFSLVGKVNPTRVGIPNRRWDSSWQGLQGSSNRRTFRGVYPGKPAGFAH